MVYYETDDPVPQVKCGMFKWLDAGWAGINMVQPAHIRKGVERFAQTFKTVIEAPAMQVTDELAGAFRHIDNLSTETLRHQIGDHFSMLRTTHAADSKRNQKWFKKLFKDDTYLNGLQREELKALITKAYLKHLMGRGQGIDVSALTPQKRPG